MVLARWRRLLAPLLLSLLLFVTACSKPDEPSRFSETQEQTSGRNAPPAVADGAVKGGKFNKFFPGATGGYEVVPAQEKEGFAEYKLNQGGTNVAVLSINDTTGNPTALTKFQGATTTIAGYPAVQQGQTGTAILVGNRYQVKVQSRATTFTADDRAAWLQKFDLRGLEKLS